MRQAFDPSGRAMYRSLSQRQNPYLDRPQGEEEKPGEQTPFQPLPTSTGAKTATGTSEVGGSGFSRINQPGYQAGAKTSVMSPEDAQRLASGIQPAPAVSPQSAALTNTLSSGGSGQQPQAQRATSYGDPYEYLMASGTRGGRGGSNTVGAMATGAGLGAAIGSSVPVIGTAIGAGIGAAAGGLGSAFTRQAATRPTDYSVNDASNAIQGAYQTFLGRDASPEEIQTHLTNQGLKPGGQWVGQQGIAGVLNNIENSEEAQRFAQQGPAPSTSPAPGPAPGPVSETAPGGPATPAGAYKGQLEGFNMDKFDNAAHNSPKYVFARLAQNYNVKDPAQREQLLAALKADPSGYFKDASWGGTNKDKLIVGGNLDPKFGGINTFDVIRNAAGGGDAWQWGPLGPEGQGASAAGMPTNAAALGAALQNLGGDSSLPGTFPAALSSGLRGTVNLTDPNYAKQMIDYLMNQLALGGALK